MRIVWLSHRADLGGAQFALVEAADALARQGHESHVVLPRDGPLVARLEAVGAQCHVVANNPWLATRRNVRQTLRWTAYNLRAAVPAIARLAKRIEADVVVTNSLTVACGGPAARMARLPHAWYLHEFGTEDHGLTFLLGRRATFSILRRTTDVAIANSKVIADHFAPLLGDVPVGIARYAVTIPPIRASAPAGDGYRIALLGHMSRGKGQLDAIEAVAQLAGDGRSVSLELVGGGDPAYQDELRRRVLQLGLSDTVRFSAFRPDALSVLASSDVSLMCSRSEAFGRVTVEAMKLGRPVVGADAGATPELIRDGWNGFLYPVGDARVLAAKLMTLRADRDLGSAMGAQGREWAEREFNPTTFGNALVRHLEPLVGGR